MVSGWRQKFRCSNLKGALFALPHSLEQVLSPFLKLLEACLGRGHCPRQHLLKFWSNFQPSSSSRDPDLKVDFGYLKVPLGIKDPKALFGTPLLLGPRRTCSMCQMMKELHGRVRLFGCCVRTCWKAWRQLKQVQWGRLQNWLWLEMRL